MRIFTATKPLCEQAIRVFLKDKTLTESDMPTLNEVISDAVYQMANRFYDQTIQDSIVPQVGGTYFVLMVSLSGGAESLFLTQTTDKVEYTMVNGKPVARTSVGKIHELSNRFHFMKSINHSFFFLTKDDMDQFSSLWILKFSGEVIIKRYEIDEYCIKHEMS